MTAEAARLDYASVFRRRVAHGRPAARPPARTGGCIGVTASPASNPSAASQRVGLAGTQAKQEGEPCP
jgi:hypothetical protein